MYETRTRVKRGKRRKRDEAEGAERAERVSAKALGCNFSRYIRDESGDEKRKGPGYGEKGDGKAREERKKKGKKRKVSCEFLSIVTTVVRDGGMPD